jgi:hypothetical protein
MFEKKFPKQTLRKQTKGRNLGKAFLPMSFQQKNEEGPFEFLKNSSCSESSLELV